MKPAREPASSCPKPCVSLKKPHESCSPLLVTLVGRKIAVVRHQLSLRNLPVQACDSRAQGFSPPLLARRQSSCPPPSPNLVSMSYGFSFRMVFFYLVTTDWISDISLFMGKMQSIKIRLHGRRGKRVAESFSRQKPRHARQKEGGLKILCDLPPV